MVALLQTFVACWVLAVPPSAVVTPSQTLRGDLDGDGVVETVEVYRKDGADRGFLRIVGPGGGSEKAWISPVYPMWAAWVADMDGDGRAEVLVGTWTRQARHKRRDLRRGLTVLTWRGRALVPLWRGSALARPVEDLAVADLDGDPRVTELLSLERTAKRCYLTAYRFDGFGFRGIGRRRWAVAGPTGCDGVTLCGASCVETPKGPRQASLRGRKLMLTTVRKEKKR